jgi:hypothetical protein
MLSGRSLEVSELLASIIVAMSDALMLEAASTSEMSVNFYQTIQCNNKENSCLVVTLFY